MPNFIYFAIAKYFQIWAKIVLNRWHPIIIAIVGTAGKTTTLYSIEEVLKGQKVKISAKANSATGIPLDILNLKQSTFDKKEWLKLFLLAPIKAITVKHDASIYLCEMDTDREGEMAIHTQLIKPYITCWTSCYPMHTQGFPGETSTEILQSLAHDTAWSAEYNTGLILANGDTQLIISQLKRSLNPNGLVSLSHKDEAIIYLKNHQLSLTGTQASFVLNPSRFEKLYYRLYPHREFDPQTFPKEISISIPYAIVSRANMYGVAMAVIIGLLLGLKPELIVQNLKDFRLPASRMSLFAGLKATTILDSSYNSSPEATIDAIETLVKIGGQKTIAVLGDMRELGKLSQSEHEKLARTIVSHKIRRVILIGPQISQYTYPLLLKHGYLENRTVFQTNDPQWAADLIKSPDFLRTGETILIKGSQNTLLLEGLIEQILVSAKDKKHLCRREILWEKKRTDIYKPALATAI